MKIYLPLAIGILLCILALVDYISADMGTDLTGVSWSPIALTFSGAVLIVIAAENYKKKRGG